MSRVRTPLLALLAMALIAALVQPAAADPSVFLPGLVNSNPVNGITPHIIDGGRQDGVKGMAQIGNTMVVAGSFTQVEQVNGGPTFTRNHIFSFDVTTGAISTTFVPQLDGKVESVQPAPDGLSVFVGGYFSTVNGQTHKRIARVYLSNGQNVPGFNANVTSGKRVMDMSIDGNTLYLGGQFSKIGSTNVVDFAALNADTGAVDPQVSFAFAGNQNGGPTRVQRMDISPDGSTIVAIGNFATVNGLDFRQIVKLNVGSRPATIADWQTNRFKSVCASKFDSYMRDVDIAPDGTYFVVATTGAYMGGPGAGVLCDTVTRWEMSATGSNQQPSWADYTGGDTTWSVLSTGEAIYVGGHMRWENNPFGSDAPGPGAVPRVGTAALDPLNGLPLAWTATREPRREGVFKLLATSGGVWFGSDSCCISGERHERLAWLPIAGGTAVPAPSVFHLPNELWKLPVNGCSSVDASILYRVNAAGGSIPSLDCGMDWQADDQTTNPLRNTGSNVATYAPIGSVDGTVPATTPSTIFSSERWDPNTAPEMSWNFPAPAGHNLQVRLYFGNQCTCTSAVGQRRFSVAIDGTPRLTNYDIVADVGNQRGTMKQFQITSDGTVNIDFTHVTENPLINGIEIVDLDVPAGPAPGGATQLEHRAFDGTTAGGLTTLSTPTIDWGQARGAFVTNGSLYTGWSDGKLYERSFNGTSVGPATAVDLHGLTSTHFPLSNVTGMFLDNGRLYYTVSGSSTLFYRYFTPSSDMVGAETFTASTSADGYSWNTAVGLTVADGQLFVARSNGSLDRIAFSAGKPTGAITTVSGPGLDGINWKGRGLFLFG